MPADFTIVDGDMIMWLPMFGPCLTMGPPMGMTKAGAKKVKVTKKKVCLAGDEMQWKSMPIGYMAPPYVEPGMGIAKFVMLGPDQKTMLTKVEGKNAIIKGSLFMAKFMVMMMAKMPAPPAAPIPDPMPFHMGGMGKFINTNMKVKMG